MGLGWGIPGSNPKVADPAAADPRLKPAGKASAPAGGQQSGPKGAVAVP
jgi:hypothetical protein